ncbi:MAG: Uma2 family endonuclease [Bryobacteraceae bacterium]|nr:Uma2 family endonuclease [Bryobacteraceae bacterium]
MATAVARLTIDDFELLSDEEAENKELVDGELVEVPGNVPEHNLMRDGIITVARPVIKRNGVGVIISEQEFDFGGDAHAPDIAFISRANMSLLNLKRRVQPFAPDLAIEIESASNSFRYLVGRIEKYLRFGTREGWILSRDTRRAFLFSANREAIFNESHSFEPESIPGLSIPLRDIFEF